MTSKATIPLVTISWKDLKWILNTFGMNFVLIGVTGKTGGRLVRLVRLVWLVKLVGLMRQMWYKEIGREGRKDRHKYWLASATKNYFSSQNQAIGSQSAVQSVVKDIRNVYFFLNTKLVYILSLKLFCYAKNIKQVDWPWTNFSILIMNLSSWKICFNHSKEKFPFFLDILDQSAK